MPPRVSVPDTIGSSQDGIPGDWPGTKNYRWLQCHAWPDSTKCPGPSPAGTLRDGPAAPSGISQKTWIWVRLVREKLRRSLWWYGIISLHRHSRFVEMSKESCPLRIWVKLLRRESNHTRTASPCRNFLWRGTTLARLPDTPDVSFLTESARAHGVRRRGSIDRWRFLSIGASLPPVVCLSLIYCRSMLVSTPIHALLQIQRTLERYTHTRYAQVPQFQGVGVWGRVPHEPGPQPLPQRPRLRFAIGRPAPTARQGLTTKSRRECGPPFP